MTTIGVFRRQRVNADGWVHGWMDGWIHREGGGVGEEGIGKNTSTTLSVCNLGDFMKTPCTL